MTEDEYSWVYDDDDEAPRIEDDEAGWLALVVVYCLVTAALAIGLGALL